MASRRGRRRCCMTRRTTNACSAAGGSKRRSRRTSSRNRLHFLPRCRSLLRKQGRRVMVNMVLRGAVLLWAAFFAIVGARGLRSEEHTSELQSLMRISYAVFCLKKKNNKNTSHTESLVK